MTADPRRFDDRYDPDQYPREDRYSPEPPDDAEPDDNIPDAYADRLTWDSDFIEMAAALDRDYAEEAYLRDFCPACGTSPCESVDGHADLID